MKRARKNNSNTKGLERKIETRKQPLTTRDKLKREHITTSWVPNNVANGQL